MQGSKSKAHRLAVDLRSNDSPFEIFCLEKILGDWQQLKYVSVPVASGLMATPAAAPGSTASTTDASDPREAFRRKYFASGRPPME